MHRGSFAVFITIVMLILFFQELVQLIKSSRVRVCDILCACHYYSNVNSCLSLNGSVQRSCDQKSLCTSERRSNQIGGCGLEPTVIVTVELVRFCSCVRCHVTPM